MPKPVLVMTRQAAIRQGEALLRIRYLHRPTFRWWFVAVLSILFLDAVAYAKQSTYQRDIPATEMVRIPGHVLPALAKAKRLAPSPGESNQHLSLTVVLKPDDVAGFENYLREVYDPDSQNFHHFLMAQEIDARFGPSEKSYQSLQEYLTAHNLKLAQGASDYQTITVTGTRADVESAFELTIGDYQIGARKFYANRTDPALPAQLAAHVMAVIGLNDLAEPMHSDQSHPWLSLAPSIGDGFNIAIAAIAGTVAVLELPFEIALMIFLATIITFS